MQVRLFAKRVKFSSNIQIQDHCCIQRNDEQDTCVTRPRFLPQTTDVLPEKVKVILRDQDQEKKTNAVYLNMIIELSSTSGWRGLQQWRSHCAP